MREILFRGKETFNGEWVEGYYEFGYSAETEEPTHYMWVVNHSKKYGEMFMVTPETVGEYTGLTDKNGKKIFEGDIVDIQYPDTFVCNTVISYIGASFYGDDGIDAWELDDYTFLEVIGNIHDNPELLKGE